MVAGLARITAAEAAEELIVVVDFGGDVGIEDLIVLQEGEQIYLPLAEFAAAILVPLETEGGVISGTVTTTELTFAIDHAAGRITIDGETEVLGSADALHSGGELYLATIAMACLAKRYWGSGASRRRSDRTARSGAT